MRRNMKSYRDNMRDIKHRRQVSEDNDRALSTIHKRKLNQSLQMTAEKDRNNLTIENINIESALKAYDVTQRQHSDRAQSARDHTIRCRSEQNLRWERSVEA